MTVLSMTCSCCGLIYEIPAEKAVLDCPACGTPNARPSAEGPSLEMLRHAVRQRLSCDFHNAERSYQQVLLYHPDEHEALWGRLLCHYGVEYVEDPATKKRMPTVHTVRNKPLRMQPEFETACEFAPPEVAARYRAEAAYIDEAQVAIRLLAEKCPPYDVFICHKTTEPGSSHKTEDYHRAYQLYVLLKEQGVRAFFAPECLNAVAGADYEAGIYHAIHTARVMLVICSKEAYLTSAWVRSEWTRFLSLMDEGKDLRLVPLVYDHFDLAKLPAEFRMRKLQGLTMGELDSTRKLLDIVGAKPAPKDDAKLDPRLERAFIFLEDEDWARADEYAEKVLDEKPREAQAYVVKLLSRLQVTELALLSKRVDVALEEDGDFKRALRYADERLRGQLNEMEAAQAKARQRWLEERRKAEEARRKAEEQRKAEEACRKAVEQRKAEEARRKAEERQKSHASFEVGKVVTYGHSVGNKGWRKAFFGDGVAPMKWRVLALEGEKALLLAEQPVADKRYHETDESITWEKCSLRKWLNGEFLNDAFSAEERGRIALSQVSADKNPEYSTNPGNATQDRLFLLSISEVEKYLPEQKDRILYNAAGDGLWWWLRSPGNYCDYAAGVWRSGEVYAYGRNVIDNYAVRPAFWLNLGS